MLINLRNALMAGRRLPYDAEVEYLESTGTQWIDTGIIASATCDQIIDAAFMQNYTGYVTALFGAGNRLSPPANRICTQYGEWTWWNGGKFIRSNVPIVAGEHHECAIGKNGFYLDGNLIASNAPSVPDGTSILYGYYNTRDKITNGLVKARIKLFRIVDDGVLVRDLIPVRKGTVGYLYDRVSGKLFGNSGTGDFVLGQDVVPVEYLQSTGTQWIDTGTPTADKYIFECLFTDATADIKLFGNSYAYGRYRDLAIYQSRYRGTSIATSSNAWDRIEIDVAQPRLTVTRSGSTVGSATSWWSAYTGATPDTQYGTAFPFGGHINAAGIWYGTNRVHCFNAAQGVRLRTRLFESWLGSELIEKLLPVRVGTEGAMMDVLTRRVYRNTGTGAFTFGNNLKYPIPAT